MNTYLPRYVSKGGALYLIFPVIVIVIVVSAMLTFISVQSYGINIVESTTTMTGKTRYIAPPYG